MNKLHNIKKNVQIKTIHPLTFLTERREIISFFYNNSISSGYQDILLFIYGMNPNRIN